MLVIDLAVSVFVLVALAAMFSWLIYRSYKGLDLPEDQAEEVEKLRSALQLAKQKLIEQNELLKEMSETTYEEKVS